MFFIFYSMIYDSGAVVFKILATSRSLGNIHCSYKHYQPGKITLQVPELIIELIDIKRTIFLALIMTVAAEIVIEKSGICAG